MWKLLYNTSFHYTAWKTIFSFSRRPEKMVFRKRSPWNMIFLVLVGNMIFLFPENLILPRDGKWKMIFLRKKYTEIWYFIQMFWKDGLFKKDRADIWSFLYSLKRWFFFRENGTFFPWTENEREVTFLKKYTEKWHVLFDMFHASCQKNDLIRQKYT